MANICVYKIKVIGRKQACYTLIDMMPLYNGNKEILSEEGTDYHFELVFKGDCKWGVNYCTEPVENIKPFTDEELEAVEDGDHWNKTLCDKSILLDCDIYCNSKDIDDSSWAVFEHWNRGKRINDECPKELHIKKGRDYGRSYIAVPLSNTTPTPKNKVKRCSVQFEDKNYWCLGDYDVDDIVEVEGLKAKESGRIIETKIDAEERFYPITRKICHAYPFDSSVLEDIYLMYKPKERKEWLVKLGLDEKTTKKKFFSICDRKWTKFAAKNNDWNEFVSLIKNTTPLTDI